MAVLAYLCHLHVVAGLQASLAARLHPVEAAEGALVLRVQGQREAVVLHGCLLLRKNRCSELKSFY